MQRSAVTIHHIPIRHMTIHHLTIHHMTTHHITIHHIITIHHTTIHHNNTSHSSTSHNTTSHCLCAVANRIVMTAWMWAWCCKTQCNGCMNVAWGLLWGGSRSRKPRVFPLKVAAAGDEGQLLCGCARFDA